MGGGGGSSSTGPSDEWKRSHDAAVAAREAEERRKQEQKFRDTEAYNRDVDAKTQWLRDIEARRAREDEARRMQEERQADLFRQQEKAQQDALARQQQREAALRALDEERRRQSASGGSGPAPTAPTGDSGTPGAPDILKMVGDTVAGGIGSVTTGVLSPVFDAVAPLSSKEAEEYRRQMMGTRASDVIYNVYATPGHVADLTTGAIDVADEVFGDGSYERTHLADDIKKGIFKRDEIGEHVPGSQSGTSQYDRDRVEDEWLAGWSDGVRRDWGDLAGFGSDLLTGMWEYQRDMPIVEGVMNVDLLGPVLKRLGMGFSGGLSQQLLRDLGIGFAAEEIVVAAGDALSGSGDATAGGGDAADASGRTIGDAGPMICCDGPDYCFGVYGNPLCIPDDSGTWYPPPPRSVPYVPPTVPQLYLPGDDLVEKYDRELEKQREDLEEQYRDAFEKVEKEYKDAIKNYDKTTKEYEDATREYEDAKKALEDKYRQDQEEYQRQADDYKRELEEQYQRELDEYARRVAEEEARLVEEFEESMRKIEEYQKELEDLYQQTSNEQYREAQRVYDDQLVQVERRMYEEIGAYRQQTDSVVAASGVAPRVAATDDRGINPKAMLLVGLAVAGGMWAIHKKRQRSGE